MSDKLIVLYSFIIILNPAIKLCTAADLSKNATSVAHTRLWNTRVNSVTKADEDTWQPIIHTHKWLAAPTTLTPALSVSTTPSRSSDVWHSRDLRNNMANNSKQKQQGYINSQTHQNHHYYQNQHHHNGNYSKRHIKTSTSSSFLLPSTSQHHISALPSYSEPSQSIKNIKLRSHFNSTTNTKNNIKNTRGKGKNHPNTNHQQQQLYPLNNIETVYPQIQIPKDIISQVQQQQQPTLTSHQPKNEKNLISSKLNLNHIEDVAKVKHHIKPSSSTSAYWRYLQQPQLEAKHIISLTPKLDTSSANTTSKSTNLNMKINTFRNENETDMRNVKNSSSISLTKTLNSFVTNENLIDNEITNTEQRQQHNQNNHHYSTSYHSGGVKSVTSMSNAAEENPLKATKSHSVDTTSNAVADDEKNFNGKLLLLRKTLDNTQEFYDNFKNIILSHKDDNNVDASNSDNEDDADDDYDIYSNEDKNNDDHEIKILNSSPYQVLKDTSTTVAAVVAAAMDSFNIKNILLPSASMAEVQGRQRQVDNVTMRYSFPEDTNQMQNVKFKSIAATNDTQQATGRLWNLLSTKPQTTSTAHSSPSSLLSSTSKALTAISSGRKVKKVKKKFKKFLLPLVLAYKLKFMALIPLLIGGLTLLVGTTGLAGFFFALFTAVMSLKSGSRSAIVVKKY